MIETNHAIIHVTGTKAHRDRKQHLDPKAVKMLRGLQADTLKDGGPFRSISPSWAPHRFKQIVEAAGISPIVLHDLRVTFCSRLAELDVNQTVVQHLAGHSSSATTAKFYQGVAPSTKRDAIKRLSDAG